MLTKPLQEPIYAIYGMVCLADEIVDIFYSFNQLELLSRFRQDTLQAVVL